MSDLMKWPDGSDPSSPKPNNPWIPFVCDSHLEWLLDMMDRLQRGEELDAEDTEHYNIIREQAYTFMAQAEVENWSEEERRVRMIDAGWKKSHATQ